jgi:hypothetical protein
MTQTERRTTAEQPPRRAVHAALLQVCLGARAKTTRRGNKLGDLVRHGHDGGALVRVGISNSGTDGWRHDVYGDRIYVEVVS